MFPNVDRHHAYWGAPAMGFCYDSPRMDFGPRPMHHGNPFGSFMGGFIGGLGMAAACGWGNSYVGYPSAGVSIFPRSYPAYQGYNSFGYDYSALALDDAFGRFVNSFSMPRYMNAPTQMPASNWTMPTSGWTMPTQTSNYWSTPAPSQNGTPSFSTLTQSGRQSSPTYSVIPPRQKTQTPAQGVNSQVQNNTSTPINNNTYTPIPVNKTVTPINNTAPANQTGGTTPVGTSSTAPQAPPSVQAVDTGSANVTEIRNGDSLLIIGDASKAPQALNESSVLEAAKAKGLNLEVQKYNETMSGLDKTSKPSLENVDTYLYNGVVQYQQMALTAMQQGNAEVVNDHLNSLSSAVKKYQEAYRIPEPPKDAATIKAEEDAFNSSCKGGDCGDYSDRLQYDKEKDEWVKSTKKGYPKQPIAPESILVEVPEEYRTDKSGIKYYANPEALKHVIEMSEVAFAQRGIQITVNSSYRRFKDQEREFETDKERIRRAKADGYDPVPKAAPPGYSEHHTGNSFDLGDSSPINLRNEGDFLTNKAGEFVLKDGKRIPVAAHVKWLEKNAKVFGFEMSYPPDNKLGVLQEGWHWRFNPELCEKYKNEREALVEKYKADPSEAVNPDNIEDEPTKNVKKS